MKRSEDTMDPEVERELDALERALAGLPVDEEMAPIATLVADVREQRPEPDDEWAAELDRLVAGGFAGRPRSGAGSTLGSWIGSLRGRSMLAPAGALATLLVVVAVGVGVTQDSGSDDGATMDASSTELTQTTAEPATGDIPVPGDGRRRRRPRSHWTRSSPARRRQQLGVERRLGLLQPTAAPPAPRPDRRSGSRTAAPTSS